MNAQTMFSACRPEPEVKFIGHAGFLVRCGGVTLLCDPWISQSGAFLHTWHQYPPNDFLDRQELYDADFLYISHDHADHFDKSFLADFPKGKVTLVIADFVTTAFADELEELGFRRIVRLGDRTPYRLCDAMSVEVIRDPTPYKVDSTIFIEAAGRRILDKNDCHITDADLDRLRAGGGIDLLFAQYSGAMWYPAVYGYPPEKERAIARGIRDSLQDMFVAMCNRVGAANIVHCAGPPCFLDDEFIHLNWEENGIFPDQMDVLEKLSSRVEGRLHLVLPGDRLRFDDAGQLGMCRTQEFDFSQKRQFLESYQTRRRPLIDQFLASLPLPEPGFMFSFKKHIGKLFAAARHARRRVNALVKFSVSGENGGAVYVDCREDRFVMSDACEDKPAYEIIVPGAVARLLAEGKEHWEHVLLSLRFAARRDPDVYNWPLFAILRYGHDRAQMVEVERTMQVGADQKITVHDADREYKIQRFCPHAGEDLANARVENGVITCPRHAWQFDLNCHGKCINGGNMPVRVYEVTETEEVQGQA